MNNSFKPLALAAAVAALSAGTAGVANAGSYPSLGDAAFVPYYTVEQDWVTGVHIINSSDLTQVVKIRLRRAEDSLDILDFNLIMSPKDEWTGTLGGDDAEMRFVTEDNTCTAPELLDAGAGKTYAPVFGPRIPGAQEGYIEVIAMGSADENQPISVGAEHVNGVPVNCDRVRNNFFVDAVIANDETFTDGCGLAGADQCGTSNYDDTDNVLKVSYFTRDSGSGIEFGNNAVHFEDFSDDAMMTHQQFGLENYANEPDDALFGWDFPDVRGGGNNVGSRYSYQVVRDQLGADAILNDWSYNPATGAATDWVVTFPGQYALQDFYQLEDFLAGDEDAVWDYRQIPVVATFDVYDREEASAVPGGLNFSPSPAPDAAFLDNEVNVVTWGGKEVLNSKFATNVNPAEAGIASPVGWASLAVDGKSGPSVDNATGNPQANAWCDVAAGPVNGGGDLASLDGFCDMYEVDSVVPMVGFAVWERTFAEDTDRNYGRTVEHSFTTSN